MTGPYYWDEQHEQCETQAYYQYSLQLDYCFQPDRVFPETCLAQADSALAIAKYQCFVDGWGRYLNAQE